MKRSDFFARSGIVCLIGLLLACRGVGAQPEPQPRPLPQKSLQILNRAPVPEGQSVPTDIRWASDDSVYVSWFHDGVAEVAVDGTRRRSVLPGAKTFSTGDRYQQLAVSASSVIAASPILFYTRPRTAEKGQYQVRLMDPGALDFDLQGDRMIVLGISDESWPPGPGQALGYDGVVAWLGTTVPELRQVKPLLRDAAWPAVPSDDQPGGGVPTLYHCQSSFLGAVRFLADGSMVVAPGFQKDVYLFNAQGDRVRSWTSEELGLDTDCSGITPEEEKKLRLDPAYNVGWLNAHYVVDDILPLPQGAGVLVRGTKEGLPFWTLKVLTPGRVETYSVPLAGRRPADRLHGDVRNGKIALLLSASQRAFSKDPADLPAEIVVAELPK